MASASICPVYNPSHLDTQRFWDRELVRERPAIDVPVGLPKNIASPLAWKGADIASKEPEWKLDLTDEEVVMVEKALLGFEFKFQDLSKLSASTFELPTEFSQRLRKLSDQLYNGVGFQIIHGLDPTKYTARQNMIMYAGISAHICPQRGFVDVFGKAVIAHIVNVQASKDDPKSTAPAFTNVPLSFHTDNCEIMAFFYLDTALEGGQTVLSSIWQTYNELAAERPDVLHTLTQPWVLDTFKPVSLQPPRHVRPLQRVDSDKLPILFRFSRYPITGFQRGRNPELPEPTTAQQEAADCIQFRAAKNSITLPVVKGDILLVNDMALFHAREAFDDGGIPMKRHLVKMYMRDPEQGWEIPLSIMENEWKTSYTPNQPDGTRVETWDVAYKPGIEELSMLNG